LVVGFALLAGVASQSAPSPSVQQAIRLKTAGHLAKAEAVLRTFLHQHPKDYPALDELGLVLNAQGRREEALLQFKKLIIMRPYEAGIYSNMGICLEALNRDDEALAAFKKALELQPNQRSAHVDIANFYRYHGHPHKAVKHLKRAIEITPTDVIAHGGLGAVLSDLKEWKAAEQQYRVVMKLAPSNVHGITELGNVLLRTGRTDPAIKLFQKALRLSDKKWVRAYDGLARAYREKKELPRAQEYADKAVKLRPTDTQSHDVLASIFMAEGHSRHAAAQYALALRFDPKDKQATKKLPQLTVAMGKASSGDGHKLTAVNLNKAHSQAAQKTDEAEGGGWSVKHLLIGVSIAFIGGVGCLYGAGRLKGSGNPGYRALSSEEEDPLSKFGENFAFADSQNYEL